MKFTGVLVEIGNKTRGTLSFDDVARAVKSKNKKQVRIILIICSSFGQKNCLKFSKTWIDMIRCSLFSVFVAWTGAGCDALDSADAMLT